MSEIGKEQVNNIGYPQMKSPVVFVLWLIGLNTISATESGEICRVPVAVFHGRFVTRTERNFCRLGKVQK